jgi:hypothetical protein
VILQEQWGQEHKSNARAMGTVLFADKILYHHCELDVLANMRIRL